MRQHAAPFGTSPTLRLHEASYGPLATPLLVPFKHLATLVFARPSPLLRNTPLGWPSLTTLQDLGITPRSTFASGVPCHSNHSRHICFTQTSSKMTHGHTSSLIANTHPFIVSTTTSCLLMSSRTRCFNELFISLTIVNCADWNI